MDIFLLVEIKCIIVMGNFYTQKVVDMTKVSKGKCGFEILQKQIYLSGIVAYYQYVININQEEQSSSECMHVEHGVINTWVSESPIDECCLKLKELGMRGWLEVIQDFV